MQEASQAGTTAQEPAHAPLMIAALYDTWVPKRDKLADSDSKTGQQDDPNSDDILETVTIVTMDSEGTPVAQVHDRMPVFLSPSTAATWLDPAVSFGKVIGPVLRTAQEHARRELCMYEVSNLVSNVKNESPDCVLPKKEMDAKQFSNGLGKFFTKKAQPAAEAEPTK